MPYLIGIFRQLLTVDLFVSCLVEEAHFDFGGMS
jgi:hypothetical protein